MNQFFQWNKVSLTYEQIEGKKAEVVLKSGDKEIMSMRFIQGFFAYPNGKMVEEEDAEALKWLMRKLNAVLPDIKMDFRPEGC